MTATRRLLIAVPAALCGVGLAWVLAHPAGPSPSAVVRVVTLGLGSTVFGLAALTWLGRDDRRPLLGAAEQWRWVAGLSGAWAVSEALLLVVSASDAHAGRLSGLSVDQFTTYLTGSGTGRVGLVVLVLTTALAVGAAIAYRCSADSAATAVLVSSGLALIVRPVTGHMSQQLLGSALGALHALAAALWCGALVALVLTAHSRGLWAVWLPRYSTLAWRCVWVLMLTGVIDALVKLGGVSALWTTGYGRIVAAKLVLLLVLLAAGWWWRRTWVPGAVAHRVSASSSTTRAIGEIAVMAVAFGLAAALATTG
ncbi:MAG: copper resistance protein CopD [Rhodococcus sp.]|nr:copper resistance protein CopD [Rhodococcus sp. (in: high G+C Gram-positive bacteria)]